MSALDVAKARIVPSELRGCLSPAMGKDSGRVVPMAGRLYFREKREVTIIVLADGSAATHLRDIVGSDFPAILALNAAEVEKTSHMDHDGLAALLRMSAYGKVVTVGTEVVAFLIALPDGVPYESDNFRWFAARMPHFLYIDRVVVDARFAGRGLGSRLYADLFHFAGARGTTTITCEYNIDPPNPASRAFHDKFGFREVGTQWVAGGTKQVSLQAADTRAAAGGPARSHNPGGIP